LFSALFHRKPPLDENSIRWMFEAYGWAFRNFPANVFFDQTQLVLADDRFFPMKVKSIQGQAETVFARVVEYAGMAHWSWQVADSTHYHVRGEVEIPEGARQGFSGMRKVPMKEPLPVIYEARWVGNLEMLVAGFSHTLAQYLVRVARELPPGGAVNWPHAIDLLTIFLGFGVPHVNSLSLFHPSRSGEVPEKKDHLSQWDAAYALAIFCVLKKIPSRDATVALKRPLRSFFRRAMVDVQLRQDRTPELWSNEIPEPIKYRA